MKISNLSTRARNTEVNGTATNIINIFADSKITNDETLRALINDELKLENEKLSFAIEMDKTISTLEEIDQLRDVSFVKAHRYVQGLTNVPDEQVANSSTTIFSIFEKYGRRITKLSYTEETSEINSMLGDLDTDQIKDLISEITYLPQMIEELRTAQRNFEAEYVKYLASVNESKSKESATAIKPRVLDVINNKLIIYLNAQSLFNTETYADLAKDIDLAIDKTNNNVKQRRGKIIDSSVAQ